MAGRVWYISPLLWIGATTLAAPVYAQDAAEWRAVDKDDRCDLRFTRDNTVIFMVSSLENGSYSLSGSALMVPDAGDLVEGEIRAVAGDRHVLFVGDETALQEQMRRTRQLPVGLFLSVMEGKTGFALETEAGATEIPLEGITEAANQFGACVRKLQGGGGAIGPTMISFDGMQQLGAEASRQRLLSEKIGYTLTIDAEGNATDCDLSRHFRRRATEIALCRPFLRHARFDPARDASGNAIEGTFSIEIDFNMWMTRDGYLEAEDR